MLDQALSDDFRHCLCGLMPRQGRLSCEAKRKRRDNIARVSWREIVIGGR
jgi:hypothetical protein